jgi:hypothetical protein
MLFDEWLLKFDNRLRAEKRNDAVTLDGCTSHSINTAAVRNVSVYFLSPNTTSKTQPIKNFKLHYRSQLVRQRLAAHEEGVSFQFDIRDSMLGKWYSQKQSTVVSQWDFILVREMKNKIRQMIHQIFQALAVTKMTGMH